MRIIELTKRQFDEYAITHKNRVYYQTSQYGVFMSRNGYKDIYVAMLDFDGKIVAAALILIQRVFPNYKIAYSPRGFLIDFYNFDLLSEFVSLLKEYLKKKKIIALKIDPPIEYVKRDKEGKPIPQSSNNINIVNFLGSIGFVHTGFNLYFENTLPRWNSVIDTLNNINNQETDYDYKTREFIKEAERKGIVVYKGTRNDIKTFYNLIPKDKKINYYHKLINIFSNFDMIDLFFTKVSPELLLKNSRAMYEKELIVNSNINQELLTAENRAEVLSRKMESDKLIGIYKKEVVLATQLFDSTENVIISTCAVIKYGDEIFFITSGVDEKYIDFGADYLLTRVMIEGFAKAGFKKVHLNGITGDFNPKNKYFRLFDYNKGFNAKVVEYIGEFNLVLNPLKYSIYKYFHKRNK